MQSNDQRIDASRDKHVLAALERLEREKDDLDEL